MFGGENCGYKRGTLVRVVLLPPVKGMSTHGLSKAYVMVLLEGLCGQ